MKKAWSLSASSVALAALAACSSAPKLAPPLEMPALPAEQRDLIDVKLEFAAKQNISENVVQLPSHSVKRGSSVVINVPSSLIEANASKGEKGDKAQDFKTKDFFNEAEQQIEKVFIGNNFRVISRSKFEAKLRDLRDASRCDLSTYRCLHDQVAPEVRPILADLKAKFDANKITAVEYSAQIALFKEKMQTASAGRNRSEDQRELTDISEVIRAAQSGDIQADYILQINVFDTKKRVSATADLRREAKVREFIGTHPEVRAPFENGKNKVSCAIVGAELNAKLIHVKTGEIVWIGSHELNEYSSGVQSISVEMGQRTYVANAKDIRQFVDTQNQPYARQARYNRPVQVPAPVMRTDLIEPIVSSGRCEKEWKLDDVDTRSQLARKVAHDLISTIRSSS
jgi:hypothetical protein